MTFGAKLRAARQQAGLTQRELAACIGARHNSLSNWENDHNRPDPDQIGGLCRALNVSADYFFDEQTCTETLAGLDFALYGELRRLDERDKQDVLDFIRFKTAMREKEQKT